MQGATQCWAPLRTALALVPGNGIGDRPGNGIFSAKIGIFSAAGSGIGNSSRASATNLSLDSAGAKPLCLFHAPSTGRKVLMDLSVEEGEQGKEVVPPPPCSVTVARGREGASPSHPPSHSRAFFRLSQSLSRARPPLRRALRVDGWRQTVGGYSTVNGWRLLEQVPLAPSKARVLPPAFGLSLSGNMSAFGADLSAISVGDTSVLVPVSIFDSPILQLDGIEEGVDSSPRSSKLNFFFFCITLEPRFE